VRIFSGVLCIGGAATVRPPRSGARAFTIGLNRIVLRRGRSPRTPTYSGTNPRTCCSNGRRWWRNLHRRLRPRLKRKPARPEPRLLKGGTYNVQGRAESGRPHARDCLIGPRTACYLLEKPRLIWCRAQKRPPQGFFDWLKEKSPPASKHVQHALTAPIRASPSSRAGSRPHVCLRLLAWECKSRAKIARNDCSPCAKRPSELRRSPRVSLRPSVEKDPGPWPPPSGDVFKGLWKRRRARWYGSEILASMGP